MWTPTLEPDQTSHPFHTETVALADLCVDDYERPIDEGRVDRIVAEFDASRAHQIQVSRRTDRTMWIIDGQHTAAALQRIGIKVWEARVHEGLSREREAGMFRDQYDHAVRVSTTQRFNAELLAGDPTATDIDRVLGEFGYKVAGTHKGDRMDDRTEVTSIRGLKRIHRLGGADLLRDVGRIVTMAWPSPTFRSPDTWNPNIVPGIGRLLVNANVPIDGPRLVRVLARHKPSALDVEIASRQPGRDKTVAIALLDLYNRGGDGERRISPRAHRRPHLMPRVPKKDMRVTWDADATERAA